MLNNMDLSAKAAQLRKELGEDVDSPIDIFALVQGIPQLTLVLYPLGANVSGACVKTSRSVLIAINADKTLGRQRFSLAHELYHYKFDAQMTSVICPAQIGSGNEEERAADLFASYLLLPPSALLSVVGSLPAGSNKVTLPQIIQLEQRFGMSHQAVLFRLQQEKVITAACAEKLRKNVIYSAAKLGYDTSLYKKTPAIRQKGAFGYYVKLAEQLLQQGLISQGKYEEILLDAGRDDIVYGTKGEVEVID